MEREPQSTKESLMSHISMFLWSCNRKRRALLLPYLTMASITPVKEQQSKSLTCTEHDMELKNSRHTSPGLTRYRWFQVCTEVLLVQPSLCTQERSRPLLHLLLFLPSLLEVWFCTKEWGFSEIMVGPKQIFIYFLILPQFRDLCKGCAGGQKHRKK